LAMAWQAEGHLLQARGELKDAEEAFIKCIELWKRTGWPYYQAKALVAFAESVGQTSPDKSRHSLKEAAEIFKRLGAKHDLKKTESELAAFTQ